MNQVSTGKNIFSGNGIGIDHLLNSIQTGVIIHGPDLELLYCNSAARKLLSLQDEEISLLTLMCRCKNLVGADGMPVSPDMIPCNTALQTRVPVEGVVLGIPVCDNVATTWFMVHSVPVLDENGEVIEIVSSFNDITALKEAEEKLNWLYQNLEARAYELASSNADMEKFVAVATHDLQEPLRLISSFLQLLKMKYTEKLDARAQEYIGYAVEGAQRMKKLILDLLEYAKFRNNREGFTDVNSGLVLKSVLVSLEESISKNRATVESGPLPQVYADPALLEQLFENLIGNSLKYRGSQDPMIRIACEETQGEFQFSVSDNGIGIKPEYSDKIFNLFERLHNNESFEGTGVGLAICEKIARLHRGSIGVHSEPGKGSTFYFTIPKCQ